MSKCVEGGEHKIKYQETCMCQCGYVLYPTEELAKQRTQIFKEVREKVIYPVFTSTTFKNIPGKDIIIVRSAVREKQLKKLKDLEGKE